NTWTAGNVTGFFPVNKATAQLSYVATGTSPITTAQYEGNTVGAYLQAADQPGATDLEITPQVFYTPGGSNPAQGQGLNLFTDSTKVLTESMLLQIPTATGTGPWIAVKHFFTGQGGQHNFDISVLLFRTHGSTTPGPVINGDTHTNAIVCVVPIGVATSNPYVTTITGAYTTSTYSGFTPIAYSISQAQVIAVLQLIDGNNPNGWSYSHDPTQYLMTTLHINAEIQSLPSSDTLGWSCQNWVASMLTTTSAVGSAAYTIGASSWKTLPVGGGGYVRNLIVAADGTMVGRTDTAGAYLYNGSSWNQLINVNSMPASFVSANFAWGLGGAYELAIAPSNTQIFYMVFDNTMWKSTNKGTTWTQLSGFTHTCNPYDGNAQIGQKMAVDPNNVNIVYAGVEGGGLYVTVNGGTSWSLVSGVPAGTGAGVCGIVFGPASNQIGGVTQVIYACRQGTGVYVTVNGGTSWSLTSSGPTTVQNAQLDASGNYWCSGNSANIWKYSGTWSNVTTGGGN